MGYLLYYLNTEKIHALPTNGQELMMQKMFIVPENTLQTLSEQKISSRFKRILLNTLLYPCAVNQPIGKKHTVFEIINP